MGSIGMQEILVILLIIAALGLPALIAIVVVLWVTKRNQPSSKMPPLAVSTPAEREQRLEELKSLRERDLITEAEYTEKRTQIINHV
jgi:chromosome condensin MukBEF ATPase and DNA-binding subunit MukB